MQVLQGWPQKYKLAFPSYSINFEAHSVRPAFTCLCPLEEDDGEGGQNPQIGRFFQCLSFFAAREVRTQTTVKVCFLVSVPGHQGAQELFFQNGKYCVVSIRMFYIEAPVFLLWINMKKPSLGQWPMAQASPSSFFTQVSCTSRKKCN